MVEQLEGGGIGGYLRRAAGVRLPRTTADPASRPIVPRWPFLTLAIVLLLLNLPSYALGLDYGWATVPVSVMLAAPVAIGWYRPMLAWALALIPLILLLPLHGLVFPQAVTPFPWLANQLAAHLPVMYLLAVSAPRAIFYPAVAVTLLAGLSAVPQNYGYSTGIVTQGAVTWILATGLAVALGRARLQRRNAVIKITEEQSRLRVLEERTRLARELHDVVAHHMSVIAVQASTAPHRIDPGAHDEISREFQAIGSSARESLRELRQVLDVLRGRDDVGRPGLADVPKLIESARLAGVPVRLVGTAADADADGEIGYAAYRIVQEALSNVIKHAPGAATTVGIDRTEGVLEVEVINEPPGRPVSPNPDGHGLIGMRERVDAIGGTVHTGPTEAGGFRVEAALPLPALADGRPAR